MRWSTIPSSCQLTEARCTEKSELSDRENRFPFSEEAEGSGPDACLARLRNTVAN